MTSLNTAYITRLFLLFILFTGVLTLNRTDFDIKPDIQTEGFSNGHYISWNENISKKRDFQELTDKYASMAPGNDIKSEDGKAESPASSVDGKAEGSAGSEGGKADDQTYSEDGSHSDDSNPDSEQPANQDNNNNNQNDSKQPADIPGSDNSGISPVNNTEQTVSQSQQSGGKPSGQAKGTNTDPSRSVTNDSPMKAKGFNLIVLNIIKTYNGDGYPYLLNTDYANYNGVTEDIYYLGNLFLKANPSGDNASHCSGITFEVFFRAMQDWNKRQGKESDQIKNLGFMELQDFMLDWYVANGPKETSNLTTALEKYGLGRRIYDLDEAMPGDFIDFSRDNNTGHTVVFIDWIKENGRIIGLKYWSSQESTDGIAYKNEYFNITNTSGKKRGHIIPDSLYIGRVTP